jgi:hypothetical protein
MRCHRFISELLLVSLVVLAGCNTSVHSSVDSEPCATGTATDVALDAGSDAGSAIDLYSSLSGNLTSSLRWFSHDQNESYSDTTLTVALVGTPGQAQFIDFGGGTCSGNAEITVEAQLSFVTDDGAFSEQFAGLLFEEVSGTRGFRGKLPLADAHGTYDYSPVRSNYRTPVLQLNTLLAPLGGSLFLDDGSPSTSATTTTTSAAIAEWPSM